MQVGDIIDACAAPGNKTSHIAALTNRHRKELKCKIFAFDKNPVRAELLQKRCVNTHTHIYIYVYIYIHIYSYMYICMDVYV
jgi:16S rRNA C967 or C1407 C5-methylase (RsmB/RsmF family)